MSAISTAVRDRLIVALDLPSVAAAAAMVDRLGDSVTFYKIGMELTYAGGLPLVAELARAGKKVVGWDVGHGFRPNDVVQQETRRTLLSATPEGRPLLQLEHFGAESALSLVWVNPQRVNADDDASRVRPGCARRAPLRALHGNRRHRRAGGDDVQCGRSHPRDVDDHRAGRTALRCRVGRAARRRRSGRQLVPDDRLGSRQGRVGRDRPRRAAVVVRARRLRSRREVRRPRHAVRDAPRRRPARSPATGARPRPGSSPRTAPLPR